MHILVVEDESRILSFLLGALNAEGHTVHPCKSYQEAKDCIQHSAPNFLEGVILDRMLGTHDGTTLIPFIRKKFATCAILVLSALDSPEDKAAVLDLGADDYLAKPFSLAELSARLRALSRRVQALPIRFIKIKNCQIDLITHEVKINNQKLNLPTKEYQLLNLFMQSPGRVFNKFQLLDKVWNTQLDIESNVVEVSINHLRKKLETSACTLEIMSKRNIGYWIET